VRLEIGAGEKPHPDYDLHVDVLPLPDIEVRCHIDRLPFATRSLEALRAFSLGQAARDRAEERVAVPLLKQAAEIDPNFAMAHARLGAAYANMGQRPDARAALIRAYELRGRASEIERFYIEARHAEVVLNDDLKAVEVYSAWQHRYPNDFTTYNNLAGIFLRLSRDDEALAQAQQAVRMNPDVAFPYANLSEVFIRLARYDEARQVVEAALERGFKYPGDLVRIGVAQRDQALIEKGLSLMSDDGKVEAARVAVQELELARISDLTVVLLPIRLAVTP